MFKKACLLLVCSLLLGGCFNSKTAPKLPESQITKQLINALPVKERPFVAVFPHPTNKLITFYLDNVRSASSLTVEIEYLSGNALKGGRATVNKDAAFPYAQAFLLGTCSAGGKCSFDKDITTGSVKTKLEINKETHVLKSNYVFIDEATATNDQKISFVPTGKLKSSLIVGGSHGYLGNIDKEVTLEPVVFTAAGPDLIAGKLSILADASEAFIWDGQSYKSIKFSKAEGKLVFDISSKPQKINAQIVRDDLKGEKETADLYLLGPIVLVK